MSFAFGDPIGQFALREVRAGNLRDRINVLRELVWHGLQDPEMRQLALQITSRCEARDDLCELKAIYDFNRAKIRYSGDLAGVDTFSTWRQSLMAGGGDCLPGSTLLVRAPYTLVPIEDVNAGDVILDGVRWAKVTAWWDRGEKPVLRFDLNNGCALRCTEEHRVLRVPYAHRSERPGCAEDAVEVLAGELRPGDDLLQPAALPFGTEDLGEHRAVLLGAYVADGSAAPEKSQTTIAGDPQRKGLRERVIAAAVALGISHGEEARRVSLYGRDLAQWFAACGRRAALKHLPQLNFDERTAGFVLGAMEQGDGYDDGGRQRYDTASKVLALQYRLLHRMFGRSVSMRYTPRHTSFGDTATYRMTVRSAVGGHGWRPWARVREVVREEQPVRVYDVETESHRIYLPESDTVVHNCDDHLVANATAAVHNGFSVIARVTTSAIDPEHVYAVAIFGKLPPHQGGIALDTTLPGGRIGEEPAGIMRVWDEPLWVAG